MYDYDLTHEERTETLACDLISRQAAIDAIGKTADELYKNIKKGATFPQRQWFDGMAQAQSILEQLPTAQPERDIPVKPIETTDKAWGIPLRQAVCPNCDSYLGTIHFICEGDKRKVTYCDSCGQAIDWSEWEWDAERREE